MFVAKSRADRAKLTPSPSRNAAIALAVHHGCTNGKPIFEASHQPGALNLEAIKRTPRKQSKKVSAAKHINAHIDLHHFVPGLLTWLYNRLSNESSKLYRKWYGIGVTDWRVLAFLGIHGESTAANMSRFIALDKAAISRSILLLKESALVDSKQFPGRRVGLQLTAAGKMRHQEILAFVLEQEKALLSGFTDGEREFLINMLHRMLDNLDKVSHVVPAGRPRAATTRASSTK
jgi:DNA-binding MarR family transcriptional regulator